MGCGVTLNQSLLPRASVVLQAQRGMVLNWVLQVWWSGESAVAQLEGVESVQALVGLPSKAASVVEVPKQEDALSLCPTCA